MKHTILDESANELLAAVLEYLRAQERVFAAVADEYGEDSTTATVMCDACAEFKKSLAPIFGASLMGALEFKNAVRAV